MCYVEGSGDSHTPLVWNVLAESMPARCLYISLASFKSHFLNFISILIIKPHAILCSALYDTNIWTQIKLSTQRATSKKEKAEKWAKY